VFILASLLLSTALSRPPRPPVPFSPLPNRVRAPFPAQLEASARAMLKAFNAEHFDEASKDFNDSMRETVSPSLLAEMKKQIEAQVGRYERIAEVNEKRADGFRVIELIARYEKSPVSVRFVFDEANRIGAAYFDPLPEPPVDAELETLAREVLTNFNARKFDTVVTKFRPALRAQLPVSRVEKLSTDVAKRFGTFRSIDRVRQINGDKGLTTIELMTSYSNEPSRVWIVFDSYRRVAGLHIGPVQVAE